jgi:hypothetical protein
LQAVLAEDTAVVAALGSTGLASVMAPQSYLGVSHAFIDEVLARHHAWRHARAER